VLFSFTRRSAMLSWSTTSMGLCFGVVIQTSLALVRSHTIWHLCC
jgi:hypothetical protein